MTGALYSFGQVPVLAWENMAPHLPYTICKARGKQIQKYIWNVVFCKAVLGSAFQGIPSSETCIHVFIFQFEMKYFINSEDSVAVQRASVPKCKLKLFWLL